MEPSSYPASQEDAREKVFLVGRGQPSCYDQVKGCPYATTLSAWSAHWNCEVIIALACKRWGCEHCGRVKVAMLAHNVERAAPTKFITLTTDAKLWPNGRAAFDGVRRKLPDFTKIIRKEVGEFEYVRVLELHKNGMPHWHLLARSKFIKQAIISKAWAELTGSVIVDIRAAKEGKHAARYVMKYMTKCAYCPWTSRRVSWSKKFFPQQPKSDKEDWQLTEKEHFNYHPARFMYKELDGSRMMRCGAYAWLVNPPTETRASEAAAAPDELVSCTEDCGS